MRGWWGEGRGRHTEGRGCEACIPAYGLKPGSSKSRIRGMTAEPSDPRVRIPRQLQPPPLPLPAVGPWGVLESGNGSVSEPGLRP